MVHHKTQVTDDMIVAGHRDTEARVHHNTHATYGTIVAGHSG